MSFICNKELVLEISRLLYMLVCHENHKKVCDISPIKKSNKRQKNQQLPHLLGRDWKYLRCKRSLNVV